uniref:Putative secreted protein n=1 Tax=Anopheles darlingi TaxID=43151 RepID=A0A2M4DDW0_ANODA
MFALVTGLAVAAVVVAAVAVAAAADRRPFGQSLTLQRVDQRSSALRQRSYQCQILRKRMYRSSEWYQVHRRMKEPKW